MPKVPDLIARIRMDTRDLDRAKGDVAKFGRDVNSTGGKIGSTLTSGLDAATSNLTAGFGAAGAQAKTTLDNLGTSAIASGSALKFGLGAGAVAGGLVLTKFATDGVAAFLDLAAQVRDFQRASGATAADSSRFVAVLDDLEISAETGASALFKLGREVAAGAPKLREFDIAIARNKDGTASLTETLLNVADAYSRAPDQASKTAIAFAAFGKQAQSLIPLLSKGRDGLAEFFASAEGHGQLLSQEDLDDAEDLRLTLDELGDAMRGVQLIGAKALLPFVQAIADATGKVATFVEFVESKTGGAVSKLATGTAKRFVLGPFGAVAQGVDAVKGAKNFVFGGGDKDAEDAKDATVAVNAYGEAIDSVGFSIDAATGSSSALADVTAKLVTVVTGANKAVDDRRQAVLSVVDAEAANRRAITSFADAVADVADKERILADARRGRTAASRDAVSVERALNSVEDAQSSIVDQERALAEARAGRGPNARAIADAERDLARAREEAAGAHGVAAAKKAAEPVADAEERLRRAREDGGQAEDERSAAEALSRSQLDAREAALNLADAREAGANRVKAAEDALAAAQQAAADRAVDQAQTFQALAEQRARALGIPLSVAEGYNVFRDKLIEIKDASEGPVRTALEGVINLVGELPGISKPALLAITADTSGATSALTTLKGLVEAVKADAANIFASSANLGTVPTLAPRVSAPAGVAVLTAGGSRPSSTQNNYTTITGVREADVAVEVNRTTARNTARAR